MRQIYAWFGVAGCFLGFLALLPGLGLAIMLLDNGVPYLPTAFCAAWAWLLGLVILSGGLHLDGLADLADAAGSRKQGPDFRLVLKDSRLGTFGAIALFFCLSGNLLATSLLFMNMFNLWPVGINPAPAMILVLAPGWGRLMPVFLAVTSSPAADSALGRTFCVNVDGYLALRSLLFVLLILLICFLLGMELSGLGVLVIFQAVLLRAMVRLADRKGGVSGDYFGGLIECSQLLFLFCALF